MQVSAGLCHGKGAGERSHGREIFAVPMREVNLHVEPRISWVCALLKMHAHIDNPYMVMTRRRSFYGYVASNSQMDETIESERSASDLRLAEI